jgi:hypothetical protein
MKLRYLYLAIGVLCNTSLVSCGDEFKDINSSEGDISTPNIRFLFTECLYQFEPSFEFKIFTSGRKFSSKKRGDFFSASRVRV